MQHHSARLIVVLFFSAGIGLAQQNARPNSEQFFKQHDANHDGVLSKQEVPQKIQRIFDRIDANGDGSISLAEEAAFRSGLRDGKRNAKPQQHEKKPADPEDTRIIRDLVYANPGGSDQLLDIYLPPNPEKKPLPVSVWIHGGGWQGGKKGDPSHVRGMLHDGFVVVDINYRLSGEAVFPAQVQDCKAAIRWLRANAATYNLDPERIGASGSSAGGHLVAFLGTTASTREFDVGENLNYSSAVQAVCNWFGPSFLVLMDDQAIPGSKFDHNGPDSPESKLVGGPVTEEPYRSLAKKASPILYISGDEPPFLNLHGDADKTVPLDQSEMLNAALKKAGVESSLYIVKGGGHGLRGGSGEDSEENLNKKAADFLKIHLSKKRAE